MQESRRDFIIKLPKRVAAIALLPHLLNDYSQPSFIMREAGWPTDYDILLRKPGQEDYKWVAYLSPLYNFGNFTYYFSPEGRMDLTGEEAIYPHLILARLENDEWKSSLGEFLDIKILKGSGNYIEFIQRHQDPEIGFVTSSYHRMQYDGLLRQKVRTTLEAMKDIKNVVCMWVSFEWTNDENGFKTVAIKDVEKEIKIEDMSGKPGIHHFDRYRLGPNSWIAAYNGYDASAALIFRSARKIEDGIMYNIPEIVPRAWDSSEEGVIDTIELHVRDPLAEPETIKEGTKYELDYEILVSNGEQGYDWIRSHFILLPMILKRFGIRVP